MYPHLPLRCVLHFAPVPISVPCFSGGKGHVDCLTAVHGSVIQQPKDITDGTHFVKKVR